MQQVINKPSVPVSTPTLHYVPRNGQIVKLPWSELTPSERESLRKADERAAYVQQFSIYGW